MRTVVICFHSGALGVVGVGVEGIQVGADALYGSKVLSKSSVMNFVIKELFVFFDCKLPGLLQHPFQVFCCMCFLLRRLSCCLPEVSPWC